MGSQTQIALSNAQARKKVSARRGRKAGQKQDAPGPEVKDAEGDEVRPVSIRPAFLPETADEKAGSAKDEKAVEKKDTEAAEDGKDDDGKPYLLLDRIARAQKAEANASGNAPVTGIEEQTEDGAATAGTGGEGEEDGDGNLAARTAVPDSTIDESKVTDPELIALLEQLSKTIDTANQVLSETPVKLDAAPDEYAGIADPETATEASIERRPPPAPTRAIRRHAGATLLRPGIAAAVAGLFMLTAGGSYYWFSSNPALHGGLGLDSGTNLNTQDRNGSAQASLASQPALPPAPPLPLQKPSREEIASLAAPLAPLPAAAPETGETGRQTASLDPSAAPGMTDESAPAPANGEQAAPDGLRGPAGQPIPFVLDIPPRTDGNEVSVMIQGVPKDVELSAGNKIGGGTWILNDQEATGLTLVTTEDFEPRTFALEVALVRSDGKIPQSRLLDVTVEPAQQQIASAPASTPAAAAPEAVSKDSPAPIGFTDKGEPEEKTDAMTADAPPAPPAVDRMPAEEEKRFLARAEEFLEHADVASARLVLEHTARRGSTKAMLLLAKTYDPEHLAAMGVHGVKGDKDQAIAWYERASRKADQ